MAKRMGSRIMSQMFMFEFLVQQLERGERHTQASSGTHRDPSSQCRHRGNLSDTQGQMTRSYSTTSPTHTHTVLQATHTCTYTAPNTWSHTHRQTWLLYEPTTTIVCTSHKNETFHPDFTEEPAGACIPPTWHLSSYNSGEAAGGGQVVVVGRESTLSSWSIHLSSQQVVAQRPRGQGFP